MDTHNISISILFCWYIYFKNVCFMIFRRYVSRFWYKYLFVCFHNHFNFKFINNSSHAIIFKNLEHCKFFEIPVLKQLTFSWKRRVENNYLLSLAGKENFKILIFDFLADSVIKLDTNLVSQASPTHANSTDFSG